MTLRSLGLAAAVCSSLLTPRPSPLRAQDTAAVRRTGDSLTLRFVDADLRAVLQVLGRHLDRPLVFANLQPGRVTLETPRPVTREELLPLVRALLESQNLELVRDSAFYRVRQREQPAPQVAPSPGQQAAAELELTVIRLRHARAADVAATLSALFGAGGADLGGGRPGTLSEELRRNVVPPYAPPVAGQPQPQVAPAATGTRSAVLEGSVTIVPDQVTNALLVRATARDAALLRVAVQELDLRPLQVLIEVTIVEARRDHQWAWGLGLSLPEQRIGRTGDATIQGTQQGGGLGDLVLRFMNLGRVDIDATLQAGASRGDVKILSRPVLLAANNQEARFLVGSQRPFVQVSRSLPTDNAARDQIVQYKDVGTRLLIRPTISADGYVTLEVTQEVSSATNETAFDAPVISTREASTQALVRDGQTIVLGGLVDRQREATGGGVPVLSDLPLLGGLFGRRAGRVTETELFLFLTPRVLRDDGEVDAATEAARRQTALPAPEPPSEGERRP